MILRPSTASVGVIIERRAGAEQDSYCNRGGSMKYHEFINRVQKLANFRTEGEAMSIVSATAKTLSERLPRDQVQAIAENLPSEVRHMFSMRGAPPPEEFSVDEFFRRVSERAHEQVKDTVREVRAVAEVIQEAVPAEVMNRVYDTLPYELRQLFEAGPPTEASRSGLG